MEIISNSKSTLNQLIDLIKSLKEEEYKNQLSILNNSSIGQHIRHIIEFYIEFESGYEIGVISYDNRKRQLDLETNQELVVSTILKTIQNIEKYDLEKPLISESNHGLNEKSIKSQTSCRREIVYALDHTVHHLAIIKIAMQVAFPKITLLKDLGIAPSTIRNNQKICAQ